MNIVAIGAGNLATSLIPALQEAGNTIVQVYSRTIGAAEALAAIVGSAAVDDIAKTCCDADIYIISVTDTALPDIAGRLTRHLCAGGESNHNTPLIVHTAGSMSIDVIPATRRGVLYPMQTFSKQRRVDFGLIPIFVEATTKDDEELLLGLSRSITTHVQPLSSEDRKYLHLAAVFCSNFANHCYALADEILARHGISFSSMLPLIDEVAAKVHYLPPQKAQTGPAIRHDAAVVKAHLDLLADQPYIQNIYKIMSESIAHDKL